MTQELIFTYTYQLTTQTGELLEGGSDLELLVEEATPLSLAYAYSIAFEAALEEIQHLLKEMYQPGETDVTLSIQKMLQR